jgi:hypothetical protein
MIIKQTDKSERVRLGTAIPHANPDHISINLVIDKLM